MFLKKYMILGYPRYCTATTLPDGSTVLNGGRYTIKMSKYRCNYLCKQCKYPKYHFNMQCSQGRCRIYSSKCPKQWKRKHFTTFLLIYLSPTTKILAFWPKILYIQICSHRVSLAKYILTIYSIRSRRGKPRGPPGSRELQTALKGRNLSHLGDHQHATVFIQHCQHPFHSFNFRKVQAELCIQYIYL